MSTVKGQCHEIILKYGKQVKEIQEAYGSGLSSHAFASIYLWRKPMALSLYLTENCYAVKCGLRGDNTWFFPCGEKDAVTAFIAARLGEPDFALCYMEEKDVNLLQTEFPGCFVVEAEPESDEYIYDREGHARLLGGKYGKLRTQVNKVRREHQLHTESLTEKNVGEAIEIVKQWRSTEHASEEAFPSSDQTEMEGLFYRQELGITGVIVSVDGIPWSVQAGYPLKEDTYDLFLSKEKERVPGISYYAKREFFLSLPEQYRYINIEEDLGIEGLRVMKRLLVPVHMNRVWRAVRK